MSKQRHEELFLAKSFSTTEAAAILEMPVETLRTQLKQGWLPSNEDRGPGKWRRISPEDLLRFRVASALSDSGVPFAESKRFARQAEFFNDSVFLCVSVAFSGETVYGEPCGVKELGIALANSRPEVNRFIVISLNAERNRVRDGIDAFEKREGLRP